MVELMFAIAILGVTLAFAVPSYRDAALNSKLNAVASSLHASVTRRTQRGDQGQ